MSAQQKLIRMAAAAHLMNRTPARDRVYASRSEAMALWDQDESRTELTAICVSLDTEDCELFQETPRVYRCTGDLTIEAAVSGANGDNLLDDIDQAIINAIGRSDRLLYAKEHSVSDIVRRGSRKEFRDDGRKITSVLLRTYLVTYYDSEPDELDPEPLDDLKRVHTDYDLNAEQPPADRARDVVEFP